MKKIIFFLAILLINGCSPRIVDKTSKTTIRQADSLLILAETKTKFISRLPKQGDSIVLKDRKTGVELTIKEFVSEPVILSARSSSEVEGSRPDIERSRDGRNKEYEFKITEPEKKIPVKINEKVIEENKTVTVTKTAWYYTASLKIVIFLIVAGILLFILRKLKIL